MPEALQTVRQLGGIAKTGELRARGLSQRAIAAACHSGRIERLRIGTFADPDLPDPVRAAHRVGGRPACVTAAVLHGLAALSNHPLHVEVAPHDSKFRSALDATVRHWPGEPGIVLHWTGGAVGSRAVTPLVDSILQVVSCLPRMEAVCIVDSALNRFPDLVSLELLSSLASGEGRRVIGVCDGKADSVLESVFRLKALESGIPCVAQAPLPGGLRGDILIGDRLLVELDGAAHHAGLVEFRADRERDAWLTAQGYLVVRFTYDQVVNRWNEVAAVIQLVMRRGDHLWPRNRRPL